MGKSYVGDIGTTITLETSVDLSSATTKEIKVRKPNGEKVTWTASVVSTTKLRFTTISGTFDQAGVWSFQAYVVLPSWTGHGHTATHTIYALND